MSEEETTLSIPINNNISTSHAFGTRNKRSKLKCITHLEPEKYKKFLEQPKVPTFANMEEGERDTIYYDVESIIAISKIGYTFNEMMDGWDSSELGDYDLCGGLA